MPRKPAHVRSIRATAGGREPDGTAPHRPVRPAPEVRPAPPRPDPTPRGHPASRGRDHRRRDADPAGDGAVRTGPLVRGPADRGTPHRRPCHPARHGGRDRPRRADSPRHGGPGRRSPRSRGPGALRPGPHTAWEGVPDRFPPTWPGPDRRTGQAPSRRREKADAVRHRAHHRVAPLRENRLHQATVRVPAGYGTVVAEDPNGKGTARHRRPSRRVSDAASGELRRRLTHRTRRHGGRLTVADRWTPSRRRRRPGAVQPSPHPFGWVEGWRRSSSAAPSRAVSTRCAVRRCRRAERARSAASAAAVSPR